MPRTQLEGKHPRKLFDEYLTESERTEVLESIYRLKEHWCPLFSGGYDKAFLLPAALYAKRRDAKEYSKLHLAARADMMTEFGWLYTKLVETVSDRYGLPAVFSPNLNFPGFHVFVGPIDNRGIDSSQEFYIGAKGRAHLDTFPDFIPEFENHEHIESFIVPIQLPKRETNLWWWDSLDKITKEPPNILTYSEGMLGHWHGQYPHAIGEVLLEEGEARISLQFHVCIKPDRVILFW
jgi:hypothetical protein